MKITGSRFLNKNISSYSLQTKTRFFLKITLLILALPITLPLSATPLRERIVAWLNRDILCEDCFNILSNFHNEHSFLQYKNFPKPSKKDFNSIFASYPKTFIFLSRCLIQHNLIKVSSEREFKLFMRHLENAKSIYTALSLIMNNDRLRREYFPVSENYLGIHGNEEFEGEFSREEIYLIQNIKDSADIYFSSVNFNETRYNSNYINFLKKVVEIRVQC